MSKLLINVDTKRSQEERIPLWLSQLAKLGTLEVRQVLLVQAPDELTDAIRRLLGAMGMEVEESPTANGIQLSEIGKEKDLTTENTEKSEEEKRTSVSAETLPICPHCHEPFKPARKNQKICKKDFCKNEQQRIYMAAYVAKKKTSEPVEVSADEAVPFESESRAPAEELPYGSDRVVEATKDLTTP